MQQLIYWMSEVPAKRFRMEHKGKIEVGYDADLILVDTDTYKTIDKENFIPKEKIHHLMEFPVQDGLKNFHHGRMCV